MKPYPVSMSYTLEKWDVLISHTIPPEHLLKFPEADDMLTFFTEQSSLEKEATRRVFIRDFEKGGSEARMQFLVQFNQGILIRLLDKLYHYKKQEGLPDNLLSFYQTIAGHVSAVLDFLEEYFAKWLDPHEQVPLRYLALIKDIIGEQLDQLKKRYDEQQALPVVLRAFTDLCTDPDQGLTYSQLHYTRSLLHELLSADYPATYTLEDRLISMNFNSFEFLHQLLAALQGQLDAIDSPGEKLSLLAAYQKRVRLLAERPGAGLYPHYVHVKEGLLHAIGSEMEYLQSFALASDAGGSAVASSAGSVHVPFKGTEIYLLHKSFIDAGGAPSETYKSFLEKTASHLSNKTRKGFSVESLQKNSDKVDYESKENVKRFLMKMIRNVDSY